MEIPRNFEEDALLGTGRRRSGSMRSSVCSMDSVDVYEAVVSYGTGTSSSSSAPTIFRVRQGCMASEWMRMRNRTTSCCERSKNEVLRVCCPLQLRIMVPPPNWGAILEDENRELDMNALSAIAVLSSTSFDGSKRSDMEQLADVWKFGLPTQRPENFKKISPLWRELGFQSDDPTSDFRGAGLLGLKAMQLLVKRHKTVVSEMNQEGLLCAATLMNVVVAMLFHLKVLRGSKNVRKLVDPSARPGAKKIQLSLNAKSQANISNAVQLHAMRAFINLVHASKHDSKRVFCAVCNVGMLMVVSTWRELKLQDPQATLMDFRVVLYSVRVNLMHFLAKGPKNVKKMEDWATANSRSNLIDNRLEIP